jgi:predicted MFS family arabinose efflux permease
LFLYRLGVGVGEAGGVAPSYALIADYFPPQSRARALAIYSLGIPIGLAAGTLLGAYIASAVEWRTAFYTVGIAGIVIAPIFRLIVRDCPRRDEPAERTPLATVFPLLAKKPAFWLMAVAAGCSSLTGYGLALWTPSVLMRSFHFDLVTTGQFMGSLLLIGGTIGVFAGGWFADKLGPGDRGWYAKLPAIAWLITAPTFAAGMLSTGAPALAWVLLVVPNALNILWLGPMTTAVQRLVPAHMRATASASFLLINNLIGLGVGPWLIGRLSDAMAVARGADALRDAAILCLAFYLIAAVLALLAIKPLRRDWHH